MSRRAVVRRRHPEPVPRLASDIIADMGRLGWEASVRTLLDCRTDEERAQYLATFTRFPRFAIAEREVELARLRAPDPETGKPKMTQAEAAKVLGVSKSTVEKAEAKNRKSTTGAGPDQRGPGGAGRKNTSRDAALTPEQKEVEERAKRLGRWSESWRKATAALSTLEYEVIDGMTVEQREAARQHAEFLRYVADRIENAVTTGLRVVSGGNA